MAEANNRHKNALYQVLRDGMTVYFIVRKQANNSAQLSAFVASNDIAHPKIVDISFYVADFLGFTYSNEIHKQFKVGNIGYPRELYVVEKLSESLGFKLKHESL